MQRSETAAGDAPAEKGNSGETIRDVRDEVRREASDVAAKGRAEAERRKNMLADQAACVAGALDRAREELERRDQPYLADLAGRCAAGIERTADTVQAKDLDTLLGETRAFARRRPGIFIGGAVAAGFALARFLKSSDERRNGTRGAARSTSGDSGGYRPHPESSPAMAAAEPAVAAPETSTASEVQHYAQPQ